jgi:AraC-like DNA-binding protein
MKSVEYKALARSQTVRAALSAFSTLAGMPVGLIPPEAQAGTRCATPRLTPLCRLITRSKPGAAACQSFVGALQGHLKQNPSACVMRCFAGLAALAVPVVANGNPVATLVSGGFLRRKPGREDCASCLRRLRKAGAEVAPARARRAWRRTPVVPATRLQAARRLLSTLAEHLGEMAGHCLLARGHDDPPCVACAKALVAKHFGEMPGTSAAAREAHVTAPYFCRVFKAATGMHFSEYVARCHVERARELLRDPKLLVTEVAYASGFQSIPHFNHTFKRYTGLSPNGYRASLQEP